MRIDSTENAKRRKKKKQSKKYEESFLEKQIFSIMEHSMKIALDKALDDLFKDWK